MNANFECVLYTAFHRGWIIVLCHFEHRVFVPVRHHLTTITALFYARKGAPFYQGEGTIYARRQRHDSTFKQPNAPSHGIVTLWWTFKQGS